MRGGCSKGADSSSGGWDPQAVGPGHPHGYLLVGTGLCSGCQRFIPGRANSVWPLCWHCSQVFYYPWESMSIWAYWHFLWECVKTEIPNLSMYQNPLAGCPTPRFSGCTPSISMGLGQGLNTCNKSVPPREGGREEGKEGKREMFPICKWVLDQWCQTLLWDFYLKRGIHFFSKGKDSNGMAAYAN